MAGDEYDLNRRLRSHSGFFVFMVKLIPDRYYHVPDAETIDESVSSQSTSKESNRPSKNIGHLVFSKFDFSTLIADRKPSGRKKDYKKLLVKAEARQKKIDEMTELNMRKGKELQEHLKWQQATNRAEGKKMKDDVTLLKRVLKQMSKKKTKSRKDWEQRNSAQEGQIAKHQEIQQQHIQERIEQKKTKSMGKRCGGKTRKRGKP